MIPHEIHIRLHSMSLMRLDLGDFFFFVPSNLGYLSVCKREVHR